MSEAEVKTETEARETGWTDEAAYLYDMYVNPYPEE